MSDCLKLSYPKDEIALIEMHDEQHKNTFSPDLVESISDAFAQISENNKLKAVITTGFKNYYSCGGTLKELQKLNRGEMVFTDLDFFKLPLMCELPTIAAVQGHAIGGGLAFACLHDFQFLSRGSIYSANFMKYGFTPGMCSTYTVPLRFGANCGNQLLFSAKQYTSKELMAMGCQLPLYSKSEVIEKSMQLAESISEKTLTSVKLLKRQLSRDLRERLPAILEQELAMHAETITSEEAQRRINDEFGE